MHNYGDPILYGENICEMTLSHRLGGILLLHPSQRTTYHPLNVPQLVGFVPITHLQYRGSSTPNPVSTQHIARFKRIVLHMEWPNPLDATVRPDQAALFELIHQCYDAFSEKDLTVVFKDYHATWNRTPYFTEIAIRAFSSLRCKNIRFVNTTAQQAQIVHEVTQLVESTSTPRHLYDILKSLNAELQQLPPSYHYRHRIENHLQVLWVCTEWHDTGLFDKRCRVIRRYFDYWHHRTPVQSRRNGAAQLVRDGRTFLNRPRNTLRSRRTEAERLQDETGEWLTRSTRRRR
ncbi:hypothetical protein OHC33_011020 [Knufia fluminis]|uniref:Uncharacterized protein n=1 Tax=Knufia fluminis TaxID=191047 RepID=A0AAN8E7L0_9EURO|nr:hypothetical protein OHC33_011020 [Knufia fluminis]